MDGEPYPLPYIIHVATANEITQWWGHQCSLSLSFVDSIRKNKIKNNTYLPFNDQINHD